MLRVTTSLTRRALSSAAEVSSVDVEVKERVPAKGRFQHWRRPVYYAPHVNPLDVGPDYSFTDGRPLYFTSQKQLDHKMDQIRMGNKIVSLLAELKEMESAHQSVESQKSAQNAEKLRWTPTKKGNKSIV